MLTTLPDCLLHKIAHHANQHAVLVRLSQSNREMRARMRSMLPELSALRLQRFWRWCRRFASTKCLAARFRLTRLSYDSATTMDFIPLTLHLRLKWVIRTCERYFNRIQAIIAQPSKPTAPHLTTPKILSAYLTGCQPDGVFGDMGARDFVLHRSSAAVIQCLDTVTRRVDEIGSLCNESLNGPATILFAYWHILHMWTDPSPEEEEVQLYRMIDALRGFLLESGNTESAVPLEGVQMITHTTL